ncbi:TPA: DUF2195 family protein [Salmonella enterica]|nr:DUF2195 family protein [Salmonella enterica]
MNNNHIWLMVFLFISYCIPALARNETGVSIYNGLNQCIQVWPVERREYGDLLLLKTAFIVKRDVRKCGCRSSTVYYAGVLARKSVTSSLINKQAFLQHGRIVLDENSTLDLVVSSDLSMVRNKKLAVYIRCAWMG